jgi:polysaccharide biosynthesis/export protein
VRLNAWNPKTGSRLFATSSVLSTGSLHGRVCPWAWAAGASDNGAGRLPTWARRRCAVTFGEDSLTGEFRVSDSGTIALPLIGIVRASGLSPDALGTRVSEALLHANLLRSPSVSAEVITYRPIFVLGEVSKPGQYPYQPGMTVVTAAAVAGGFTYRAIQSYASVVRTQDGGAVEGTASRQTFIQPGDVITVFERRF